MKRQLVSSFPFSLVFDGRDVEAEKMYLKKAYNRFRKLKDKKIANTAAPTDKKRANNTSSEDRVDSKGPKPSPAPTPAPSTEFLTTSKDLLIMQDQWEDLQTKYSEEQIAAAIVDLKLSGQLRLPPQLSCTLADVQQEFAQLQRLGTQIANRSQEFVTMTHVPLPRPLGTLAMCRVGFSFSFLLFPFLFLPFSSSLSMTVFFLNAHVQCGNEGQCAVVMLTKGNSGAKNELVT